MEIKQVGSSDEYHIKSNNDELKFLYAKLLGIEPLWMPEDLMKILIPIREALQWYETAFEEESK